MSPRLPAIMDFSVSSAHARASALVSNVPESRMPFSLIWSRHLRPDLLIDAIRLGPPLGQKWGLSIAKVGDIGGKCKTLKATKNRVKPSPTRFWEKSGVL